MIDNRIKIFTVPSNKRRKLRFRTVVKPVEVTDPYTE